MIARLQAAFEPRWAFAALLLLITLIGVLPGQTTLPPMDADESRYAQATRQMIESGDYLQIRFLDKPRNLQPAGIYWLQTVTVRAFGDPEVRAIWPHRIVSWLAAIASVFLSWNLGALLFGRRAGRIAALLIATAFIVTVEAHLAKIDSTLCAITLIAQSALARIYLDREARKRSAWWPVLYWATLGVGIMIKGPIILLPAFGTLIGLVILERRWRWLGGLKPWWGIPLAAAIAAPWLIAIGIVTDGEFFKTAVGHNLAGKITSGQESHGAPPGYHLLLFTLVFFPGSLFAWLAIPHAWKERKSDAMRLCIAWIIPAWIAFELFSTKLPHYTLPLLPAVAMISAAWLASEPKGQFLGRPVSFWPAALIWLVFGAVLAAAATGATFYFRNDAPPFSIAFSAAAILGLIATLAAVATGRSHAALRLALATALIAHLGNWGWTIPGLKELFPSPAIMAQARAATPNCARTRIVDLGYGQPSLAFLSFGNIAFLIDPAEAAASLAGDPACAVAVIADAQVPAFKAALPGEPTLVGGYHDYNYNGGKEDLSLFTLAATPATPATSVE